MKHVHCISSKVPQKAEGEVLSIILTIIGTLTSFAATAGAIYVGISLANKDPEVLDA